MLLQLIACLVVIWASLHALIRMLAHHAVLILIVGGVLTGCQLSNVQKVRLACAESAEGLAIAYRVTAAIAQEDKRAEILRGIAASDAARNALCTETLYSAVESGSGDVPRLVAQIVALTASVTLAVAPYIGGK